MTVISDLNVIKGTFYKRAYETQLSTVRIQVLLFIENLDYNIYHSAFTIGRTFLLYFSRYANTWNNKKKRKKKVYQKKREKKKQLVNYDQ